MKALEVFGRYMYRFLRVWIFWIWAPALEVLGIVIFYLVPTFSPPRWLFWAIALAGFVVANLKLFAEYESEKRSLENRIAELEAKEADILLEVKSKSTPQFRISSYSPSDHTLPDLGTISARLRLENIGKEKGKLVYDGIDKDETDLSPLLAFYENNGDRFESPLPEFIDGGKGDDASWLVGVKVTAPDSDSLARALSSFEGYSIVINYHTRRIGGKTSRQRTLTIEGNFRQRILEYWKQISRNDLVKLAESQ